jgi:hypothetical protein
MPIWICCRDRTLCQFSVNLCNINSCLYLKILCVDSYQPAKIQDVDHVTTFARSLYSHFSLSILGAMPFWRLLSSSRALFFYQFVQYMFKVILRDLTCLIWVGFWNKSCRYFQYLSREYLLANFGWIVWEIWICKDCCQFLLSESLVQCKICSRSF